MRWYGHTPCCRAPSLCRGVIMSGDAARNPTLWNGHTPRCGVMINAMLHTIFMLSLGDGWPCGAQSHVVASAHPALWRDDKCHVVHHLRVVAW